MRETFPGHYRPTTTEFEQLWSQGIFVLDANVLLNLYRYSDETRDDLLSILVALKDRLWVPYQAAREFQMNRLSTISGEVRAYEDTAKTLKSTIASLRGQFESKRHPHVPGGMDKLEEIGSAFDEIESALSSRKQALESLLAKDTVRAKLDEIMTERIGERTDNGEIEKRCSEAKARFGRKIPPGYRDKQKPEPDRYGDVLVWFEVLEFAEKKSQPICLITDDGKDDWWQIHEGKTIGPRPELVEEFREKSEQPFYVYETVSFVRYAREFLELEEKPETIDELENVSEARKSSAALEDLRRNATAYKQTLRTAGGMTTSASSTETSSEFAKLPALDFLRDLNLYSTQDWELPDLKLGLPVDPIPDLRIPDLRIPDLRIPDLDRQMNEALAKPSADIQRWADRLAEQNRALTNALSIIPMDSDRYSGDADDNAKQRAGGESSDEESPGAPATAAPAPAGPDADSPNLDEDEDGGSSNSDAGDKKPR